MKQPHGSVLPGAPTAGDSCFLSDGTLHFCFVDGIWVEISGGGGGGTTMDYGSFCCCRAEESWLGSGFPEYVSYHAADIYRNQSTYIDCYWDVLEISEGGVVHQQWLRQKFASVADIYIFIRANFAGGVNPDTPMHHAYLRVYDVVGSSVPKIDKIYGMNMFYSMLRGRKNYRKNKYCIENEPAWNDFRTWFNDLCTQGFGFGPGHIYSPNDEKALWLSRNDVKRYGLPVTGFASNITVTGGRSHWDWGSSSFSPLSVATTYNNTVSPAGISINYCGLYTDMISTWEWIAENSVSSLLATFGSFNMSWLLLYHMQSINDPNHRAIMVKPLGIDRVGLNWFDDVAYDLCALYTRKDTTPVMRKLDVTSAMRSVARDLLWVEITKWRPVNWGYGKPRLSANMIGLQPYTTQFFLRDKTTGEVSPASKSRIVLSQRHRNAPFKFEVRR